MSNIVNIPTLVIVTESVNMPISLIETKNFLRIDTSTDDDLLTRLIKSATKKCETYIGKSLITKTYKITFENCVLTKTKLPYGPLQNISLVTTKDAEGNITTVSTDEYVISKANNAIEFKSSLVNNIIEITYISGYGDNDTDIPEDIKQGLLFHIARLYDDRSGYSKVPNASVSLYNQYKNVRI